MIKHIQDKLRKVKEQFTTLNTPTDQALNYITQTQIQTGTIQASNIMPMTLYTLTHLKYHASIITRWNSIDDIRKAELSLSSHPAAQQYSESKRYLSDYEKASGREVDYIELQQLADQYELDNQVRLAEWQKQLSETTDYIDWFDNSDGKES